MGSANGVHHLALYTRDIKAQVAFFTDVLGAELTAFYRLHGLEGWRHAFVKLNDQSYIAFMQGPDGAMPGATAPPQPQAGGLAHLALNVSSREELLAFRDRIRSRGVPAVGPINHGFCESIYFGGPEMLQLEIAHSHHAIDQRAWVDPELVAEEGISKDELLSYKAPARFKPTGPSIAQPEAKPGTPLPLLWQGETLAAVLRTPDEEITQSMSEATPPVDVAAH